MIVYYFGADAPWEDQSESDINRRNMAVLLSIAEQTDINLVYNVIRCTRALVLNKKDQKKSSHPKIKNLYIGAILPERGILKTISKPLNRWLLKRLNPKAIESQNTLSWCYWPKGYEDYQFSGLDNRMVFDTDHNIIDDPNLAEDQKAKRGQLVLEAGKKAELIISSSRSMIAWYTSKGYSNTKLMMNGVFDYRINLSNPDRASEKNYQVTYCGTLSKWIKVDWLIKMAKDQPNWTINIIGKNYKTELASQLKGFKNVKMHGFLKPTEVDAIIKKSDVCIGLYREETALDVNSMKLYDYLAQGLPVVVNQYHSNLDKDFGYLINVVNNYNEFIAAIGSPKEIQNKNIESFLENAKWYKRVESIFKTINS